MNKDLLDQISADEQPMAERLMSAAEEMKISPNFQQTLETQLMNANKSKSQTAQGWHIKLFSLTGWAVLILVGVVLLSWSIRSLAVNQPASEITPDSASTFAEQVRQGAICANPLALGHNFSVFMSNPDKTDFIELDPQRNIGELRSFAWSEDGQLAVVGNTTGTGNIYLWNPTDNSLSPIVPNLEIGYLRDASWSSDGRHMVLWSSQNINTIYLLNTLGYGLIDAILDVQIFGAPQFAPNGRHIVFYGADASGAGLFITTQEDLQLPALVNRSVESESSFAFSPDGSLIAYMEYDHGKGEARLITTPYTNNVELRLLGTLPIPKGSGSSVPDTANLSWSQDGKFLVFEFGRGASDRAIYLANADGSGLVKLIESAYAPTISSDGNCLAYISNKQVFLLDLRNKAATPLLIADLPAGRSISDFRLDKLQWQP